jgi:hypothetical protein
MRKRSRKTASAHPWPPRAGEDYNGAPLDQRFFRTLPRVIDAQRLPDQRLARATPNNRPIAHHPATAANPAE